MKTAIFSGFFYLEDTTCVPHKRHKLLNFFFRKPHAHEHNVPRMLAKAFQAFQTPGKKSLNHSNTQHCIQLRPEYLANIPHQSKLKHRCRSTTYAFQASLLSPGLCCHPLEPRCTAKNSKERDQQCLVASGHCPFRSMLLQHHRALWASLFPANALPRT